MTAKRRRGRPRTQPEDRQSIHLRLTGDVYAELKKWSDESGIPQNTIIERAVRSALDTHRKEK